MKVCVVGLWHLGTVTAACLASAGHEVVGFDDDEQVIQDLQSGKLPVFEPDLSDMVKQEVAGGRLAFSSDPGEALDGAEVVWVTYDTPVDEEDEADVDFVVERVTRLFSSVDDHALILISSQIPVGTTARLEAAYRKVCPEGTVTFAYSPENLRLGAAIKTFMNPDRVIVGLRSEEDRGRVQELLNSITDRIEWMTVESAEMTKHAINAFLASSVVFINELSELCEHVGADAKEVERGLKTEARIGPGAYLSPGAAYAGGTLARDINNLMKIGKEHDLPMEMISAVHLSNQQHKQWIHRKMDSLFDDLEGKTIAVWGLTYKPGTDTLRRSAALEVCAWLNQMGARVQAHDPAVRELPGEWEGKIHLAASPEKAASGAHALILATPWPEYRSVPVDTILSHLISPLIVDPTRFLAEDCEHDLRIRYVTVGQP